MTSEEYLNSEDAKCAKDTFEFISEFCKDDHDSPDNSLFYFETEYLALKGNLDYIKLIRSLAILENQRIDTTEDIQALEKLKIQASLDPFKVKERIFKGDLECLRYREIEKVPEIDFSKYECSSSDAKKPPSAPRKTTRQQEKLQKESDKPGCSGIKVRGRVYNEQKPQTFNQLWSVEEQLRLEQLLMEIPPEPVEFRRYEKIAEALGSRTPKQVCSRVQKYYKKLSKAGVFNVNAGRKGGNKKRALDVHKQHKHYLYKPSTFFPGAAMGELEDTSSESEGENQVNTDLAHWDVIHKKIAEEKENDDLKVSHFGYSCSHCGKNPIIGLRWECVSCSSTSFCSDCMLNLCNITPPPHPLIHQFRYVDVFTNMSYNVKSFNCDNYLDPNAHIA